MSHYAALLDANVLYPAPLRDLFLQLAVTDLFKAKWSRRSQLCFNRASANQLTEPRFEDPAR